jgi:dUTP pyrophosphatase
MKIKIKKLHKNAIIPSYATSGSACKDLHACIGNSITLKPLERVVVPTGLAIEIPKGYEIQVRPRSGISLKEGKVCILGTIDSDYRGEMGIILANISDCIIEINPQDRLAQIALKRTEYFEFEEVTELSETERGTNGYGSTGK